MFSKHYGLNEHLFEECWCQNPCLYVSESCINTFSFSCLLSDKNYVCSFTDSATMSPATVLMKLHETNGQIEHLKILLLVTLCVFFPFDAWDRLHHLIVALPDPSI